MCSLPRVKMAMSFFSGLVDGLTTMDHCWDDRDLDRLDLDLDRDFDRRLDLDENDLILFYSSKDNTVLPGTRSLCKGYTINFFKRKWFWV